MTASGWYHFAVFLWHQTLYLIGWLTIYRWVRDRWRNRRRCEHEWQRGIYGDEIITAGGMRAQCLECGRFLPNLPSPDEVI